MKKILSLVLVLAMVLALSATAFAADPISPGTKEVTKEYTLTGGDVTPGEVLEFEVELVSGVDGGVSELPTVGPNGDNKVTVTSSTTKEIPFNINFPSYSKVGVYTYTITEKEGTVLGVTYDTTPIYVVVTITNKVDEDGKVLDEKEFTVAIHKGSATADKTGDSEFKNEFGLGQLTVSKKVAGNLASNEVAFKIVVTFNGGANAGNPISYTEGGEDKTVELAGKASVEVPIFLKNGESVVFTNIPAGVTYTVVEDPSHTEGNTAPETTDEDKGYTVSYTNSDEELKIAAGDKDTVAITNTKETEPDTGVILESLPYVVIGLVVAAAVVVLIVRKSRKVED